MDPVSKRKVPLFYGPRKSGGRSKVGEFRRFILTLFELTQNPCSGVGDVYMLIGSIANWDPPTASEDPSQTAVLLLGSLRKRDCSDPPPINHTSRLQMPGASSGLLTLTVCCGRTSKCSEGGRGFGRRRVDKEGEK